MTKITTYKIGNAVDIMLSVNAFDLHLFIDQSLTMKTEALADHSFSVNK